MALLVALAGAIAYLYTEGYFDDYLPQAEKAPTALEQSTDPDRHIQTAQAVLEELPQQERCSRNGNNPDAPCEVPKYDREGAINISLAMPKDTTAAWVSRFGQGIANACRYLNAGQTIISGGDLTRADTISVVITATGNLVGEPTLRTANHDVEGFNLIHTGNVGASAAGLAVALHGNAHDLSRDC